MGFINHLITGGPHLVHAGGRVLGPTWHSEALEEACIAKDEFAGPTPASWGCGGIVSPKIQSTSEDFETAVGCNNGHTLCPNFAIHKWICLRNIRNPDP